MVVISEHYVKPDIWRVGGGEGMVVEKVRWWFNRK
jgi:hypothetical protein